MTLLFSDPLFLEHRTGPHPERPARLHAVLAALDKAGLAERCTPADYEPLGEAELLAVHAGHQVAAVRDLAAAGGGSLDPDTPTSERSFEVAVAAAGACCSAVDAVLAGRDTSALCLTRPPGHHATRTRSMGFCLFNNVALAARRALDRHGVNRVLVVDWDVHHGNGTQDVFYTDPQVFVLSAHRFGRGFYPGTGSVDETGEGDGLGTTLNVPLRQGVGREVYLSLFERALSAAADKCRPELVLVSAGFDAHRLDPIGGLGLEAEDFTQLTRLVQAVADTHAAGRVVSCLEGGYDLDALGDSVAAHLAELLGAGQQGRD